MRKWGFSRLSLNWYLQPSMQTVKSPEHDIAPPSPAPEQSVVPVPRKYDARKAALLSLVPGLGHFYVGQPVVGSLCLVSSILGICFVTAIVCGKRLLPLLTPLVQSFGLQVDATAAADAGYAAASPAAVGLYCFLFLYLSFYFARDAYQQAIKKTQLAEAAASAAFAGSVVASQMAFSGEGRIRLSGATSFSYLLHCGLLLCFAIASFFIIRPPELQKTEIEILLEPPPPPPVIPPPAPRPKPRSEPPKVEKPEPKPIVQPPKPTPVAIKPPETQLPDPNIPTAEPVTTPGPETTGPVTGTGTSTGTAQGTGADQGTGDSDEIDLSGYVAEMEKRIRKAWYPPKGNENKKIILRFKVNRAGEASSVRLKTSSGIMIADEAAIAAVKTASPFDPLPKGAPEQVDILFTFDYSVFGGGKATLKN